MQKEILKIKGLVGAGLIIAILLPAFLLLAPGKTQAFWGFGDISIDPVQTGQQAVENVSSGSTATGTWANFGLAAKDLAIAVLKQAAMAVAQRALQEVTKSTVNWINSGFHGSPLFLENPQSFFEDIAKSEVKNMVDIFGYDSHKYPFGKAFAVQLINTYKNKLEDNASYSLNKVITDPVLLSNYQTNFNVGGWNGFIINTQYPQNNPVGFEMEAQKELAFRIRGTGKSPAAKVQETLDQGMGFLSPKMCPEEINPDYNNGYNEFQRPSFNEKDWREKNKYNPPTESGACATDPEGDACQQMLLAYDFTYEGKLKGAKQGFDLTNSCVNEDGENALIATTPGAVVANQITTSLGSVVRNKELAAAMGNSLSAIFDALLDKFLGDGLNALASNVNRPPATEDNWNYQGMTLGVAEEGVNKSWDGGAEVPIILDEFKKQLDGKTTITTVDTEGTTVVTESVGKVTGGVYTPGDIANTEKELLLMTEVTNSLGQIWPEARKLDVCLPGPDIGWQERLTQEMNRNTKKIQSIQGGDNEKDSLEAEAVLKEVKFAIDFFKDWIGNKMITELPNSVFYMEAVDDIKQLGQESKELADDRRKRTQALARLKAIKIALDAFTVEPEPGSAGEKTLISLKKQHDGIRSMVSTAGSLSDMQTKVDIAKEKFETLKKLTLQCEAERKVKGWGTPGGALSSYSGEGVVTQAPTQGKDSIPVNSEQAIFCNLPIIGGYSHEMMLNQTGVTHPEIPLVNAKKVLEYEIITIKSFLKGGSIFGGSFGNPYKKTSANINLNCSAIYNAKLLDYKGDLPGLTTITEQYEPLPEEEGDGTGTCTYEDGFIDEGVTEENCEMNNGSWEPAPVN